MKHTNEQKILTSNTKTISFDNDCDTKKKSSNTHIKEKIIVKRIELFFVINLFNLN
jgi:hypothetical protein